MCKVLGLPSAAAEIVQTHHDWTNGDRFAFPYFFMVGAGISNPPIPLASGLVALFRKEIERLGLPQPPETGSSADVYFSCIDRAFRNPELRREFLSRIIQGHEPSLANRQIARLLGRDGLTNLAVTPNFDRMIPRALRLQGDEPLDYDLPEAMIQRFRPMRQEIQVLQIHGTVQHFDFCNVREEIQSRSRRLERLLYGLLMERSPIVVGYSGWEEDAFMTALGSRLREARGSMAGGLFWFCYSHADVEALPAWLQDDPSVRIVAPPGNGEGRMPAEEVLGTLLGELSEQSAVRKSRMSAARGISSGVERIATAEEASRGEPERALEELSLADLGSLTFPQRMYYDSVLERIYLDTWQSQVALAREACSLRARHLQRFIPTDPLLTFDMDLGRRYCRAIYGEGISLLGLHRDHEAIAKFEHVIVLGESQSPRFFGRLAGRAAHARNGLAVAFFRSGRTEEAIDAWTELMGLDPGRDPEVQEAHALGLFNLGLAFRKLGQPDEAAGYWRALRELAIHGAAATPQVLRLRKQALLYLEQRLQPSDTDLHRTASTTARWCLPAIQDAELKVTCNEMDDITYVIYASGALDGGTRYISVAAGDIRHWHYTYDLALLQEGRGRSAADRRGERVCLGVRRTIYTSATDLQRTAAAMATRPGLQAIQDAELKGTVTEVDDITYVIYTSGSSLGALDGGTIYTSVAAGDVRHWHYTYDLVLLREDRGRSAADLGEERVCLGVRPTIHTSALEALAPPSTSKALSTFNESEGELRWTPSRLPGCAKGRLLNFSLPVALTDRKEIRRSGREAHRGFNGRSRASVRKDRGRPGRPLAAPASGCGAGLDIGSWFTQIGDKAAASAS